METRHPDFPHHWDCIYTTEGHPKGERQCTVTDGSRRVPDGSIAAREHIRAGGLALGVHNVQTGEFTPVLIEK